jgi:hypothetical protein
MAIDITIQNKVISFPESSASPNWAPAIIEFAKATADALNTVVGGYDIAPQTFALDSYNPGSNIDLPNLEFPVTSVRSFTVNYAVHRTTDSEEVSEGGTVTAVYNASNPTGFKFDLSYVKAGEALIVLNITDTGTVQITTSTLSGINHEGIITYRATAVLNN